PVPSLDPTRRVGEVVVDGASLGAERRLPDLDGRLVADLAAIVMSAESAGGADWCVDTAASHAKVREQFGRPIGQFQAVKHRCATLAPAGARRSLDVALPEEADPIRAEVRALAEGLAGREPNEVRRQLADEGYMAPHWPRPWGRGAGAVEQLVVDEELQRARVRRPQLAVGAWALPTIIAHGTPEQQERWVGPTLHGEMTWCQMFSEPGAGSHLASPTTNATRVDGGWLLTGQKVWTSIAQRADWAICLARTDPDAPRHEGITYFLVDMRSDGIDVRPLRELTGQAMFNEVF